jgi:uncharacterized membrane-anchored protein
MFSQTWVPHWAIGLPIAQALVMLEPAVIFGALLALVVAAYLWTRISGTALFWAAFVLTRPLGAVVGDFLDKPISAGGLALSRYLASAVLLMFILTCIFLYPQRAAQKGH